MENKMGTMPMPKLMITMSLPIMISMLVQALYNIVDSMFVARLSQDALAAVSLCYPVQTIMIAIACGTGVGFNTLLSRCLGERNTDKANQVVLHGLMIALVNWLLFVVLGFLLARPFLMLFSGQEDVIDMGVVYMQICTTLSFGVFIQITYERILQASGQPVYNMIMQGIGALVNIVLDPIFIFGYFGIPAMGVAGAALATVLGQIIAMLLGIWIVQKKTRSIQIHIRSFSLDFTILKQSVYESDLSPIFLIGSQRLQHLLQASAVCLYGGFRDDQCTGTDFSVQLWCQIIYTNSTGHPYFFGIKHCDHGCGNIDFSDFSIAAFITV